tara:strand:- start:1731 stop:2357 length:627 start_codon:yes stop_codon:yes gene_type:complete
MTEFKRNNDFLWSVQIPNFLSSEKCDELVQEIKSKEQSTIGCVDDEKGGSQILKEVRTTTEYYLLPQPDSEFRPDYPNEDWTWLSKKIEMMMKAVNNGVFHFDIKDTDGELKMIEYEKGGHYTWHADFNPGTCSLRKLVAIIQLTDPSEYEGGEVQFAFQDENNDWYEMEKKKGSITFFPAFTSHRVKPITKGKRYVIQELFIGDHFV